MLNVVKNGEISDDFSHGKKKLKPVIWSHGNLGCSTSYSGFCKDVASRGYIVFAMTHADGSSPFTTDENGNKEIYFD